MAQLHTDDNFMHHSSILSELKKQTQTKWENELIDDFDDYDTVPRDYNRICIDDATPADWDALADRRLTSRGVDTPQERSLKELLEKSEDWGMYDDKPRDGSKIKSDGGSTAYYYLPEHATELRHLISHKGMSKSRGDIFKACYRLDEKEGADVIYDLNKMKFFVDDLIEMYHRGEKL